MSSHLQKIYLEPTELNQHGLNISGLQWSTRKCLLSTSCTFGPLKQGQHWISRIREAHMQERWIIHHRGVLDHWRDRCEGLHSRPSLCACWGQKIPSGGWKSHASCWWEGNPLPCPSESTGAAFTFQNSGWWSAPLGGYESMILGKLHWHCFMQKALKPATNLK